VHCPDLAQNTDQWRSVVNTVTNLRVAQNAEKLSATDGYPRSTQLPPSHTSRQCSTGLLLTPTRLSVPTLAPLLIYWLAERERERERERRQEPSRAEPGRGLAGHRAQHSTHFTVRYSPKRKMSYSECEQHQEHGSKDIVRSEVLTAVPASGRQGRIVC
jgi:hypothetical protein